jgi:hypothetical protein
MEKPQSYTDVRDAIADMPGEAAQHCGGTPPQINDLLGGRVSLISVTSRGGLRAKLAIDRVGL